MKIFNLILSYRPLHRQAVIMKEITMLFLEGVFDFTQDRAKLIFIVEAIKNTQGVETIAKEPRETVQHDASFA